MTYFVYLMASRRHGTIYVGVTNNIARRVWLHRQGQGSEFVRKYKVYDLVYLETHTDIRVAIQREKTLKDWNRAWKIDLIEEQNPEWRDLYQDLNQ